MGSAVNPILAGMDPAVRASIVASMRGGAGGAGTIPSPGASGPTIASAGAPVANPKPLATPQAPSPSLSMTVHHTLEPEPSQPISMPQPGMPETPSAPQPRVIAPRGTLQGDQDYRGHVLQSGSGISQIAHKIEDSNFGQNHPTLAKVLGYGAQGAATLGDIGLSLTGPGRIAEGMIPGTAGYHAATLAHANNAVNQDETNAGKEATTADVRSQIPLREAQTEHERAATDALPTQETDRHALTQSEIDKNQAEVKGLQNPFGKLPDKEPIGNVDQLNKGMSDRYAVLHPGQKSPPEFQLPANATKGDFDRVDKLLTAEENASTNLQAKQESQRMREAMLALATQRLGDSEKKGAKATPDEQRRADLSENLNENLGALEEIINRRPELFGPFAGRWTELRGKFGSDDADIGALQTIEHQLGMAQISAHGMRSAQGIQAAADSIMNHMHSSPRALLGAIDAARNSVKTFQSDVDRATGRTSQPQNAATDPNDPLGVRPKKAQ